MNSAAILPDGRRFAVAEDTAGRLRAGLLVAADVTVAPNPAIWAETEELAERLHSQYAGRTPADIDGLREARRLYRSFAMDPTRRRPSSEALLRRVLQGKSLYRISNAVDACNLASLSFLLPIGMYDLDRVEADISVRVGRTDEQYPGIRKAEVHLAGRLGLFDAAGGFGSPTSDSERTAVTSATARLLAVIMATAAYPADAMASHVDTLADLFVRHCGAAVIYRAILAGEQR